MDFYQKRYEPGCTIAITTVIMMAITIQMLLLKSIQSCKKNILPGILKKGKFSIRYAFAQ